MLVGDTDDVLLHELVFLLLLFLPHPALCLLPLGLMLCMVLYLSAPMGGAEAIPHPGLGVVPGFFILAFFDKISRRISARVLFQYITQGVAPSMHII